MCSVIPMGARPVNMARKQRRVRTVGTRDISSLCMDPGEAAGRDRYNITRKLPYNTEKLPTTHRQDLLKALFAMNRLGPIMCSRLRCVNMKKRQGEIIDEGLQLYHHRRTSHLYQIWVNSRKKRPFRQVLGAAPIATSRLLTEWMTFMPCISQFRRSKWWGLFDRHQSSISSELSKRLTRIPVPNLSPSNQIEEQGENMNHAQPQKRLHMNQIENMTNHLDEGHPRHKKKKTAANEFPSNKAKRSVTNSNPEKWRNMRNYTNRFQWEEVEAQRANHREKKERPYIITSMIFPLRPGFQMNQYRNTEALQPVLRSAKLSHRRNA